MARKKASGPGADSAHEARHVDQLGWQIDAIATLKSLNMQVRCGLASLEAAL